MTVLKFLAIVFLLALSVMLFLIPLDVLGRFRVGTWILLGLGLITSCGYLLVTL
jgi:hypothetical protein